MKNCLIKIKLIITAIVVCSIFSFATCKYSFKDVAPIPIEVKNFRVQPLGNKAAYTNPQLSPQVTEKLRQKIINTTRLRQTNEDDAHYDISGFISQYNTTTVNIQNTEAATNRLTIGFHLVFKNNLDPTKNFETDVSRNEDFPSSQSLAEAENNLTERIVKNIVDEIFNKIFSNW
jgi:outer membrane lipopolysaccharide assembly protein LptE/RlpB